MSLYVYIICLIIPVYIPLSKLHMFEDHPYKILENEEMDALTNSIAEYGVLSPLLVRPMEEAPDESTRQELQRLVSKMRGGI